jgi:hypothetical protein
LTDVTARKVIPIAIVIVVVAVVASIVGYYLLTRQEAGFKTYTNENYSYKLDYPANWATLENNGVFAAYRPDIILIFGTELTIHLNVYDKSVAEGLGIPSDNLDGYIQSIEDRSKNSSISLIGKPIEIVIDNHHGVRYSLRDYSTQRLVEQVVRDNYFYWLDLVAPIENYSTYEPIFQHVIDSFSFLD